MAAPGGPKGMPGGGAPKGMPGGTMPGGGIMPGGRPTGHARGTHNADSARQNEL